MTAAFVVDASVVVDFLAPGPGHEATDQFFDGLGWADPIELLAPDLLHLEVANALRSLAERKAISTRAADRAVGRLPQLAIGLVPCSSLLELAWPLRAKLTVYDAAYVALARSTDLPLVTLDGWLARSAKFHAVRAWTPDDPDLGRLLENLRRTTPRYG